MITVTGPQQVQAWQDRILPPVEQVRPGLWSIPVPIPRSPLRYVLVYVLETDGQCVVIDAGWNDEDAWAAFRTGLDACGFAVGDVRGVLITHMHPDHFGLALRLRAEAGAWIAMHPADAALIAHLDEAGAIAWLDERRNQMRRAGAPEDVVVGQVMWPVPHFAPGGGPDALLNDGDRIDVKGWKLTARWTPGHTPGHLCFYDERNRILFAGDHVLPRISPNISLLAGELDNPLRCYLDSLRAIDAVDAQEVLPAHEFRFRGLSARTRELIAHHGARLAEIQRALRAAPGSTAWEVTGAITWSRPFAELTDFLTRMALRETLAHLVLLAESGLATQAVDPESPVAVSRWYPGADP